MNLASLEEKRSLQLKFAKVPWETFTEASFLEAIQNTKRRFPGLREVMRELSRRDLNDPMWEGFAEQRFNGRAVGLFFKKSTEKARGM